MRLGSILLAGLAVLAMSLLPLTVKLGHAADIMFYVFVYILLSQSFNVLAGYTGLVSMGQATFFGIGALLTRFLWASGLPFGVSLPLGGLGAAALSIIVGIPCLRLRGHYFSIGTLALTIIGYQVTTNVFISESFLPAKLMEGYSILVRYYVGLLFAVASTVGVYLLVNSRLGMGLMAIREDENAAKSLGIDTFRSKLKVLILSAFTAGIAGGIYAFYQVALYYYDGFHAFWSFYPVFTTYVGGAGTIMGPVLGSVFYVVLSELLPLTMGRAHVVVFGIIFILVVMAFPRGFAGIWQKLRPSSRLEVPR